MRASNFGRRQPAGLDSTRLKKTERVLFQPEAAGGYAM
jgi:hypothetical protein